MRAGCCQAKSSESNKVTSNPEIGCRQSLCQQKQLINAGKGEREVFGKRVDVSWSASRETFGESKTIWKEPCRVAEISVWGLPFIITSLLTTEIWRISPSGYLIQILSEISLDDTDLADLKRELEASGERHRRTPSRSLSIPTRPRPLQPPQRPPPPGELNFL